MKKTIMKLELDLGTEKIHLTFPDDSIIYQSEYLPVFLSAGEMLIKSVDHPVGSIPLPELIRKRKAGDVVIVVSDITRPIPYAEFLPQLLAMIEGEGVSKNEIIILIATGMHRPSTQGEILKMFGESVAKNYRIINHNCENEDELRELEGYSWSGSRVKLNKYYVQAGFRIVTGLVEPHFMAGFSGGRKAICPGLVSLDAVQKFHGYSFLSHPDATSTILENNPCHNENTSVARMCPPNFAINIVLDNHKKINTIISGELFASHLKTVEYVKTACCQVVKEPADLVITSCGGYPLDATFYQCVKGFVNCLPAVKQNGEIIASGGCTEGIGSPQYTAVMKKYSGNCHQFIDDIRAQRFFIKDQWQLQMHIRTLDKVGRQNLHFYTSEIPSGELSLLSVSPHSLPADKIEESIQDKIDKAVSEKKKIAVFPEGPYCSPVSKSA